MALVPPLLTEQEQEALSRNQEIPVPDTGSEDLEFGDDSEDVVTGHPDQCWEMDITPPQDWNLPEQLDEAMVFLASEGRKKRVEVKLRDVTLQNLRRFAHAKHKEVNAWLSHNTVRKIAKGRIPSSSIMRCRWIYTWKAAEAVDELSFDGKNAKARLVVLGFEDPDLDSVPNDAPTAVANPEGLSAQRFCMGKGTADS